MSDLDTVAEIRQLFYRLVGMTSSDPALALQGESTDDIAYLLLTRGSRKAQRWMLRMGYNGWRKRTSAITWSGADATDGGRFTALPTDFLRAYGNGKISALTEANGDRWGTELTQNELEDEGDFYYYRDEELWLTRRASPPSTLFLDYHHQHPEWSSGVTIDFPLEARSLIPCEAAGIGVDESWFPGDQMDEARIAKALSKAREDARHIARQSKRPRQWRKPRRVGNRW